MNNLEITVIKDKIKGYGYNLKHNQPNGFKGIISNTWAWYKYKRDAKAAVTEIMKCWKT